MTPVNHRGRILVTGASGFVGQALCRALLQDGFEITVTSRKDQLSGLGWNTVRVGDMDGNTDWREALAECTSVVHLAARVHVMNEKEGDSLVACRAINTHGTLNLARQAQKAGVKRFVFMSSIKVNGEGRCLPYVESDPPAPKDPYAISKWEAEQALRGISGEDGMEMVILRPPLVYGPGVRANFLRLLSIAYLGLPLPLGALNNRRSLVYVGNLVSAAQACLMHPAASGQTFLVSDGEDVSTTELIRRIGMTLGRPQRLWPMPEALLRAMGHLTGHSEETGRLLDSLVVDSSKIRQALDWCPPYTLGQGLAETAAWFLRNKQGQASNTG